MNISTKADNNIAKEFFKTYTKKSWVSKILYPPKEGSKTRITGTVTRCFNTWDKKHYMEPGRVRKIKPLKDGREEEGWVDGHRLSLKPFFEYANEKIKDVREKEEAKRKKDLVDTYSKEYESKWSHKEKKEHRKLLRDLIKNVKEKDFNQKEEEFIEYIFNLPNVREMACKRETLFDGIIDVLDKIFFYHRITGEPLYIEVAKAFFVKDKRHFRKFDNHLQQYKEVWRVITKFLQGLLNKIRDLTKFNGMEYLELKHKTELNIYGHIPFAIPEYETEENKRRLLKRFEIVFYENRKLTNDEIFNLRIIK